MHPYDRNISKKQNSYSDRYKQSRMGSTSSRRLYEPLILLLCGRR